MPGVHAGRVGPAMLEDPLGIEDADLSQVVRLAGILTLVLVLLGPVTILAVGGTPSLTATDLGLAAMAFLPGAVGGLATGLGYRSLPDDERGGTWPARPAALGAVLLPLVLGAAALLLDRLGG